MDGSCTGWAAGLSDLVNVVQTMSNQSNASEMTSSLSSTLRRVMSIDGNADAIIVEGGRFSWSYLSRFVDELERSTSMLTTKVGLSVGVVASNQPPLLAAIVACIAVEGCYVTLSPMFSDAALAEDLRRLHLHVIIASHHDLARPGVLEAAIEAGSCVIEVGGDEEPLRLVHPMKVGTDLRHRPGLAVEMLSSGTTGVPKRIKLSYANLEAAMGPSGLRSGSRSAPPALQSRPALVWHPIGHISGFFFVIDALSTGRPVILMERFEPELWTRFVERYEVRFAHLNPTAMQMILEAKIDPSRLSSLRFVRGGTAPTPPELQGEFEDRYHVPVLTTYGATEFAGAVASWSPEDHRQYGQSHRGASGRAHPGIQLRTVDATSGDELGAGAEGVLEVRAPQAADTTSDWIRTTDLAVIDNQGFLWIRGRVDDVILRGGFKVHPGKVESALKEHPSVVAAAVVGVPDDRLGAVPVAAVVVRGGEAPSSGGLLAFLRDRVARYEIPREIQFVDALPLTASMKVSRPAVRRLFTGEGGDR
jgi:long-chain acyl-CoA synthetase